MGRNFYWSTLAVVLIVACATAEPAYTQLAQEGGRQTSQVNGGPDLSQPSMEEIKQGKALYEGVARCIHCHGRTALRRALTAQELFSIIKFGVPGTSHIPYKHLLSDEEILAIVQYQLHDICENGCQN